MSSFYFCQAKNNKLNSWQAAVVWPKLTDELIEKCHNEQVYSGSKLHLGYECGYSQKKILHYTSLQWNSSMASNNLISGYTVCGYIKINLSMIFSQLIYKKN